MSGPWSSSAFSVKSPFILTGHGQEAGTNPQAAAGRGAPPPSATLRKQEQIWALWNTGSPASAAAAAPFSAASSAPSTSTVDSVEQFMSKASLDSKPSSGSEDYTDEMDEQEHMVARTLAGMDEEEYAAVVLFLKCI